MVKVFTVEGLPITISIDHFNNCLTAMVHHVISILSHITHKEDPEHSL